MTQDRLDELCSIYRHILIESGVQPQVVDTSKVLSRDEMLGHCLWVLNEQVRLIVHHIGGFEETIRLLGCIQGMVTSFGLCTIDETREHAKKARMQTWDKIIGSGKP